MARSDERTTGPPCALTLPRTVPGPPARTVGPGGNRRREGEVGPPGPAPLNASGLYPPDSGGMPTGWEATCGLCGVVEGVAVASGDLLARPRPVRRCRV